MLSWELKNVYFRNKSSLCTEGCNDSLAAHGRKQKVFKRDSNKVWEINMGVCLRLKFDDITLIHCMKNAF